MTPDVNLNLHKKGDFFERHKLSKLTQEIENINPNICV